MTKRKKMHTFKRVLSYLFQYKAFMAIAIILSIASNSFALIGPNLSGLAIDNIGLGQGEVNFQKVFYYCKLMILFYIISAILTYILSLIMLEISKKISYRLRKDLFEHILTLPVGYFDTHKTGDIISKISYDIDTLNSTLTSDLVTICSSVITVVVSFVSMLMISTKLVLFLL